MMTGGTVGSRGTLGFLLLQARRPDDVVRGEERYAFAAQLGVDIDQIQPVDILTEALDIERIQDSDAVLVGGAGEFGVVDPEPPVMEMIRFLTETTEKGHPIFASCFGFQALVVGLGGVVQEDEPNAEVGTYDLRTTTAAELDPVFSVLPTHFKAQLGHKDRAQQMPTCVTNMALSDRCPHQALRVNGAPVYATQFHPELTWQDNRLRFERYMPQYGRLFGQEEAQRKLDSHVPSPEANQLLARFVDTVLLGVAQ